ncbi:hypothetical protein [Flagellimonas sp.]|jgi:hypothetical protein|uniref:hypothetical protein n=1 Tax=Flagellimonas sp. TaxID=2058762 RepID=UPI000B6FF6AE|nr:MAG: hypothetical protein CBB72_002365 [Muricauda sp. TMED12]|tara:strand:- start:1238 stop:1645 length:408 start_codon:yes stop_codon:yes gene_type:complete
MTGLIQHKVGNEIKVLAPTLGKLFKDNLGAMNDILKERACDKVTHFDCLMRLEVAASNTNDLLVNFLSGILELSFEQKALFCNVYFSELTEKKVVVQLFGIWRGPLNGSIKISCDNAYVKKNGDNIWESQILFDF